MHTKRLGDMLPEAGLITEEQLGEALKYQAQEKERLGTTLVKHNYTIPPSCCNSRAALKARPVCPLVSPPPFHTGG